MKGEQADRAAIRIRNRPGFVMGVIAAGLCSGSPALAGNLGQRDGQPEAAAATGPWAQPHPAATHRAEEGDRGGGEIVVTALRSETPESKTPVTLTAISGKGLRDAGITDVSTLDELVPNLSIDRPNGIQITIRGVTSTDGTEKGDPSAAFLLDGIYVARPQAQDVSLFDLERVEILRGPQGTLYGRNTTAGLVHVISRKPQHGFEASMDGQYGSFDQVNLTGMINLPVNDMIAVRGAFNWDRRDSFIRRGAGGASLDPARNNRSGRLSALFDVSPDVHLIVRADYSRLTGANPGAVPVANFFNVPDPLPMDANNEWSVTDATFHMRHDVGAKAQRTMAWAEIPGHRNAKTWGVQAELEATVGPFDLTYLGSYRALKRDERGSLNRGAVATTYRGDYWQNSQELRLAFGEGDRLHGQIGAYYFKEKSGIAYFLLNFPSPGIRYGFPQDPTIAESYAGFGQLTFDITPRLHVTGGARYSHDSKSRIGATVIDDLAGNRLATLQINDARRNFHKTTWRLGVDYDAEGLGLLYASVATGYKAGGFNDGCEGDPNGSGPCRLPAEALYYDPETLTAYEAGFKFRLAGDKVRLNGAAFHYDYEGLQLSQNANVCGGPCQVTTNAAKAKVDGVEIESIFAPNPAHRIDLSVNYLDARYAEFLPIPTVSFKGKALDRSPRFTAAVGYRFTYPLGNGGNVAASARTRFSSHYFLTDLASRDRFVQDRYHKTDLTLTYTAPQERFYVQAYVRNLENEITLSTLATGVGGTIAFVDPRTYGLRAGVRF